MPSSYTTDAPAGLQADTAAKDIRFRAACPEDCSHLALLADMATRRLTSHLWGLAAAPGQSAFEVGRSIIRNDETHLTRYANWRIAECRGQVVGAINSYIQPDLTGQPATTPEVLVPLNALKSVAAGTWYLSAAAIYPEHQGRGFGKALLAEAEARARAAGSNRLTLMVGSFNPRRPSALSANRFRRMGPSAFYALSGLGHTRRVDLDGQGTELDAG